MAQSPLNMLAKPCSKRWAIKCEIILPYSTYSCNTRFFRIRDVSRIECTKYRKHFIFPTPKSHSSCTKRPKHHPNQFTDFLIMYSIPLKRYPSNSSITGHSAGRWSIVGRHYSPLKKRHQSYLPLRIFQYQEFIYIVVSFCNFFVSIISCHAV